MSNAYTTAQQLLKHDSLEMSAEYV